MSPVVEVLAWGVAGSVVDVGRPGRAALGASRGGAVDADALALANRVVGNPPDAHAVESAGGLRVRTTAPCTVAIAGAVVQVTVTGGPPVGWGSAVHLPAGAELRLGRLVDGARAYLAVRGGVDGAAEPLSPPLTHPLLRPERPTTAKVWPGPRLDWCASDTWELLITSPFTVTSTSRVGVRLSGPRLVHARFEQLPSEGMVEGAVQVPPDGNPVVMLADHPATGGYPVVAVVDPADIAVLAQAPLGSGLRFTAAR
ncbi:MAG TPA: allophanate hydrolase [Acidimicrobiaceae bacterium]|nr:allophanate hydrolase [Acidimicrobiaceae bacterium]